VDVNNFSFSNMDSDEFWGIKKEDLNNICSTIWAPCTDCSQVKPSAIIKSILSFTLFIGVCAGVVYLLVASSDAKAARGGDGFGMKWSATDRVHDHNLNSSVFTDIQNAGGWKKILLGVGLFIVATCVCCPFCCRICKQRSDE